MFENIDNNNKGEKVLQGLRESSVLSLQFFCNSKTVQKIKFMGKKPSRFVKFSLSYRKISF